MLQHFVQLTSCRRTATHFKTAYAALLRKQYREFSSTKVQALVEVDYDDLTRMTPNAVEKLRKAFVGPTAWGAVAVVNIPNYGKKLQDAFEAGIDLALVDHVGREKAAAVSNTYPGWSGTPGQETHPLQSSMLFNVKEEIPGGKVDPYFGKNIFPSEEYRKTWAELADPLHRAALEVLRGCDVLLSQEDLAGKDWASSGRSLHRIAAEGPALAGRFICYDSGFTREDKLLDQKGELSDVVEEQVVQEVVKPAGHAGDGLASMRTHATPVKTAGHAADGLASMRTHATPVKTAGHAGDGLASMRTHATPVKTAGHAGDGLASMRTHATPVKTAGHAGDGLASMRTHATPVKTAGHAGDGLASMRTHATPVKSAGSAKPIADMSGDLRSRLVVKPLETSMSVRAHSTQSAVSASETEAVEQDYWLPWHIDSNFVTVLHKERYAYESDASLAPEPDNAGLLVMNLDGEVGKAEMRDDALILQMGAFAQIYSGGYLNSCRHAVLSPRPPGIARFNYCNFWYVPWTTLCDTPPGREAEAVTKGWNAMMDESYLNITMKQSFSAFRQFMTSPEARVQFADSVHFKELAELLPLPVPAASASRSSEIVVDVLTDVRCPFSFISQSALELALNNLGLNERAIVRYHPIFLNPNVPKEGESLDDYLLREYGYSKEFAHSENYPLRLSGLKVGVHLNPHRRVVNTFNAHCLVEMAQMQGKQREAVKVLSRRYFEEAQDISDPDILRAASAEIGLVADPFAAMDASKAVESRYAQLSAMVGEVPLFLIRESISGNGIEVGGNRSVADWEDVLRQVLEKGSFIGMSVPGHQGKDVWLAEAVPYAPVSLALPAQHGWQPADWPYTPDDFSRQDESPDTTMYSAPRMVQHLDEASLARLTQVYRSFFRAAPPGFAVLDLCSSWTSHFPEELLGRARVAVHGLNQAELDANNAATERHVQDLNEQAHLPWEEGSFDFVTLALSVQYLTDPRAVFSEMHRVLKPGGVAVVAFSHRCFIEKCVKVWAEETHDGEGHAHLVCRYFQHSPKGGWMKLTSVDVSPRHGDPLWVVTALKVS